MREVKILRHLGECENVVQLYDLVLPPSFEEFNDVYIVMEFMDSNLRQMIKSNQELTDQNIQYFLYHLLRGLKTIHSANILVCYCSFVHNCAEPNAPIIILLFFTIIITYQLLSSI